MATVHAYAKGAATGLPARHLGALRARSSSIPALTTPMIIIGGKIFGWFTATNPLAWRCSTPARSRCSSIAGSTWGLHFACSTPAIAAIALFCVGTASAFGSLLAYYDIEQRPRRRVGLGMGPIATGFFIAFVFLVVGCFDAVRRSSSSAPSLTRWRARQAWTRCTSR